MPGHRWELFPRVRYPRDFGIRYEPRAPRTIDPEQLELGFHLVSPPPRSHQERARDQLRVLFARSRWSQRHFARVLGIHERTLQRYLGGARIPEDRANWLVSLEAVTQHGDRALLVFRILPPTPRRNRLRERWRT